MSQSPTVLPQNVVFEHQTREQVSSLEATYRKSAAVDGVKVSFDESPNEDGTITLGVNFEPIQSTTLPVPLPATGTNGKGLAGFDASRDCGKFAARLRSAKVDFVIRYYSHNAGKNLTPSEAQLLTSAGVELVSIWESNGDHVSFFTKQQGIDDSTSAHNMATKVGQPPNTPIYFGVDCDPTQSQLNTNIIPYFQGVAIGLEIIGHGNPAYTAGVYGSGLVCRTLSQTALVTHTWLANATGWQGSKTFHDWNIKQQRSGDPYNLGFEVDPDDARQGYGGFVVA